MVILFHKRPEKNVIPATFKQIDALKHLLKKEICPSCEAKGKYYIVKYQKGNPDWEATITCEECKTTATVNHTGFNFDFRYRTSVKPT